MTSQTPGSVFVRPALLLALLLGEGLALGFAFDGDSLRKLPGGWWGPPLGVVGRVMPLGAIVGAALLIVAMPRLRAVLAQCPFPLASAWPFLLAHLIAFGLLLGLSRELFGPADVVVRGPGPWVIAWFAAVAATILLWALTVFSLAGVRALLLESGWLIPVGLVVGLAAFAAGIGAQSGWTFLRGGTLVVAFAILRTVEPSAFLDAHTFTLGAGRFSVEIAPDCSGYEGIGLVLVFVAIHLWLWRANLRFPRALLLLPIGMAAAWLANSLRIAALVVVGAHLSPDIAVGGFHSYSGVLLFVAVALGTSAAADRSTFFRRRQSPSGLVGPNPAAPWLVPFLVILAAALVTGLFTSGGFDRLYPIRMVVGAGALWYYRSDYRRLDWSPSIVALAVGAGVFAFWLPLARLIGDGQAVPAITPRSWGALWLASRVVGSALVMPMAEELAFRGYLARRLMSADFESVPLRNLSLFSILVSSAAFAALHGRMAIPAFLAGVAYACAARFRGRLADSIVAHGLTNALLAAHAILSGSWAAWN